MNLNRNFIDVQIIRIITPNTNQKANIYAIHNRIFQKVKYTPGRNSTYV